MQRIIAFLLIHQAAMIVCLAQDPPLNPATKPATQTSSCTRAGIAEVERVFKRRREKYEFLGLAETGIKNLIKNCPDRIELTKFEKQLAIVEEEVANRHFQVAQFYLVAHSAGRLKAAHYRLKQIYDSYPHFSKRAEAIYLLGDLSRESGDEEAAKKYYRSVVSEFPQSHHAKMARQKLGIEP